MAQLNEDTLQDTVKYWVRFAAYWGLGGKGRPDLEN